MRSLVKELLMQQFMGRGVWVWKKGELRREKQVAFLKFAIRVYFATNRSNSMLHCLGSPNLPFKSRNRRVCCC